MKNLFFGIIELKKFISILLRDNIWSYNYGCSNQNQNLKDIFGASSLGRPSRKVEDINFSKEYQVQSKSLAVMSRRKFEEIVVGPLQIVALQ